MSRVVGGETSWTSALLRWAWLFALWLVISDAASGALAVGAIVAALATYVSLRLAPPGASRARPLALAGLAGRLAWQSVLAGIDVARRVFDPRLPISPGFVGYPGAVLEGRQRAIFRAMASLVPGTVPAGEDYDGVLQVHCLDIGQPVVASMSRDEDSLANALGVERPHG